MPYRTHVQMLTNAEWLRRPQVQAVFQALNRDGHEARIVGGALRNTLMGLPVSDVDFAVTAPPEDVISLAEKAGLKSVPTGLDHGTVTIIIDHMPFEVTTLRQDVETHGRHATVAFTRDWTADASRRDFTINALYADERGQIFDPLGGLEDIHRRKVRFIGSARERIREDYLRILRFFSFTADYSADLPDLAGLTACIDERAGLAGLSAERIRAELLRILITRKPMLALEPMVESGLLIAIFGGVVRLSHYERMTAIEAELGLTAVPIRRLAALAVMVEEDAGRLSKHLRLSNAETAQLTAMAALEPEIDREMEAGPARRVLYQLGERNYLERILTAWSRTDDGPSTEAWKKLFSLPDQWQPPVFPLKGQDLISRGCAPGPGLGETLRKLEEKWIASDFQLTRDDLLASLDSQSGH